MREAKANLWTIEADLRCITTNGHITAKHKVVMGRGCALEARDAIPGIDVRLADLIKKHGNRTMRIGRANGADLASLPVKRHWRQEADPKLIVRSVKQLVELTDKFGYQRVVIPRPGCGNGRLKWPHVKDLIAPILDDRFTVVSK